MRNRFLITVIAGLVAAGTLRAETKLYLLYDSKCMQKHESSYTRGGIAAADEAPLVQYAVRPNATTTAFLEMEGDKPKTMDNLPKNTKSCSEIKWDDDLLEDINKGRTDLFLIWKSGKNYSVAGVATMALLNQAGQVYNYRDRDFNFRIDGGAAFQEDNLADRESDYFVVKQDFLYRECEPVWVLKREAKKACAAYTIFEFIPRYGIVQENTGANARELADNQLNLFKIDGDGFLDKMKENCGTSAPTATTYSTSTVYATEADRPTAAPATPVTYSVIDETTNKELTAGGGYRPGNWEARPQEFSTMTTVPATCNLPDKTGFHLVQKGDNLYRIARQYGLSVANLKAMNGLKGDDISACSYLSIDGNSGGARPVESSFSTLKTAAPSNTMTAGGGVRFISSAAPAPATYSTEKPASHVVEKSTDGWHVIQPGENLTLIGAAYGLTATELARLNGIARNSILFPGNKLRVAPAAAEVNAAARPVVYSTEPTAKTTVQFNSNQGDCYHSVIEGDNLSKIARTYGYTLERLMRMNGITDEKLMLQVGQRILVNDCECLGKSTAAPVQEMAPTVPSSPKGGVAVRTSYSVEPMVYSTPTATVPERTAPSSGRRTYTVMEGDTSPLIAKKKHMDVARFREINRLDVGEQLVPGQVVLVE